eukprot:CAMPEP_0205937482 /NCGR_PEP_ID=MMETSP1325-20131115/44266_1 /ASSEMBLY_ACC=CAM_ASM_000708 /TAXON_ID=236786 /ORGANISM="Florenciella sp., Strain RCC1007" /LENGTH=46 /DNA_ID= /DNA_START= /DNA_END= /DNA_ORIENTATION=
MAAAGAAGASPLMSTRASPLVPPPSLAAPRRGGLSSNLGLDDENLA